MQSNTIQYQDDGTIDFVALDIPDPGEGEVQIQGGACGICS